MKNPQLTSSIEYLQEQFYTLDWTYHDIPSGAKDEKMYKWPGPANEEILITVHKSRDVMELFHRHDFFFFNYTYSGEYDSLSYKYNNLITIREKELYAGQPFAGHALCVHDNADTIVIGVLIQKDAFFRSFLPMISFSTKLFHFFLNPFTNSSSDEYLHFEIPDNDNIRTLLEMMVIEYAHKNSDTQEILKPLALSFLMQVSRQYALAEAAKLDPSTSLCNQIIEYIRENFHEISLKSVAEHFSYHPNYVSGLLSKNTGKTFSQIVLDIRMERADLLLRETTLPVSEISVLLGYSNTSNFHKAFREYYGESPRTYAAQNK